MGVGAGPKPAQPVGPGAVVRILVAAVVAVDVFVLLLVGYALRQSFAQHRERAVVATQNLSAALGQSLGAAVDRLDLALLAIADEHARELAADGRTTDAFDAFLARERQRVSELDAIRVFDANGLLIGGTGLGTAIGTVSIADRAYFARLRDDPWAGLVISDPVVGRITHKPELVFGRRLHDPGGAFGGAVVAVVPIEDIEATLASFDVGPRGVIVIRKEDLGLVVRHREQGAPGTPGDRTTSPELRALVEAGRTEATYTGVAVDGEERIFTFRKVGLYPLLVIVGIAPADALAPWRREALFAAGLLGVFVLLTGVAARFGYRSWRRREAAVEALAEQETLFRLLAESATDLIWMVDGRPRLTYVSPAAERTLGWTTAELLAMPWERFLARGSRERGQRMLADAGAMAPFSQPFSARILEHELLARDGRVLQAEAHVSLRWSPEGRLLGAIGISRDVTERRRMEARVQLAERMASVGTLAAGVAHEVNNPLTYVLSNVGFALDQLAATEAEWSARPGCAPLSEAGEALREALAGADRVRHIMRELKTFSRADGERVTAVELNPIVETCLRMAAAGTRGRARIVSRLGEVPRVLASEARVGQVVLNLVTNAAQAIPEGDPGAHEIAVATSVAEDGRVQLEVRDTGPGIPPDVLPRIFDPFFTTKPVGEGTGLGLSICHGIVRSLGGEIRVDTEVGRGTAFRVLLPPAAEVEAPPPEAPEAAARADARRRVLVVDDDPLVARAVARMAEGACEVEVSTRPAQVLERIAAGERWDVVLCDLMMPEVSGMDLHARVAAIDAELAGRMVFMTGGAFTAGAREFLGRVPNARLEKPIDRAELAAVLAADGGGPRRER